ncbi:MAG: hypothetical protein GC202_14210 [Alphaproteobacteria bacterium]|nr:hypothetical protein [Alphaproteobacteria bacterium]
MAIELKPVRPEEAIRALEARGIRLDPTFHWQEAYGSDHAAMFTVAKSAGYQILSDVYEALLKALSEGQTFAQFAKEITPILQAKGWWGQAMATDPLTGLPMTVQLGSPRRLRLIFDANMRVSYASGHWHSFETNKELRPYLRYVHLEGQEHPRHQHHLWHNTVLPVDHPWWNTHATPNGWNCHCTIQSLNARDVARLQAEGEQLKFEAPPVEMVPWLNKATGQEQLVPKGIDPGWDHNPGKDGWQSVIANLADRNSGLLG